MWTLPLSAALGEARDLQAQSGLPADGPLAAGAPGAELLDGLSALLGGEPPPKRRAGGAGQRLSRAMGRAISDSDMIKAMPPLLRSDDGRNTVIRPMASCEEADIVEYAAQQDFPIIPCDLCGSHEQLLAGLAAENPKIPANIVAAMQSVRPDHLLDPALRAAVCLSGGAGDDEELLDIG